MILKKERKIRVVHWFALSCAPIFGLTGSAKILSALGHAKILSVLDPIVGIQFRYLMLIVGCMELGIVFICLFSERVNLVVFTTAWLSSTFIGYRLGLWWLGWKRPCSCAGNLTDALHLSPNVVDTTMKIVLIYLLFGSYVSLINIWQTRHNLTPSSD